MTFTSTLTLQPGDIILDYATWRPTAADFAAIAAQHGRPVRGVVRYQAAKTSIPEKLLYQPETKFLHDLGIGIIICHESYATRAATGYAGGIADGKYMQWWAEGVSYPTDAPIVAADDTNETAPTLPTAGLYQAGFDSAVVSPTGPYGDNDIMQWCVDHNYGTGILWYAGARAWSNYKPPIARCHVQQLVVGSVAGKYDMNVVLQPINCWLPHEVVEPTPPRKEDDMAMYFEVEGLPGQYLWNGPGSDPIAFTNPADRDVILKGLGIDPNVGGRISQEMFNRMKQPPVAVTVTIPPVNVTIPPIPPITIPPIVWPPLNVSLSGTVSG